MALSWQSLQRRLIRFEFEALFCQDLGWHYDGAHQPDADVSLPAVAAPLDVVLTAATNQGHGVVVVRGELRDAADPETFRAWLGRFTQVYDDPLVMWVDPEEQRSLWCWLGGQGELPYWRTVCLVRGQGSAPWARCLMQLQVDDLTAEVALSKSLSPFNAAADPDQQMGFLETWQTLNQGLSQIPQVDQRQHYAMVLLCRLVAVAALQRRGYLGGDEWYLHNQFGQSQQRGPDQFFQQVFQPLCQQGLTLPPEDRPLPVQERLGPLPFLPTGPFSPHPLDQRWGHLPLADATFEPALAWLGDWLMAPGDGLRLLLALAEWLVNRRAEAALVSPEPVVQALVDRTLNATVLDLAHDLTGETYSSIEGLIMAISPAPAGQLLEQLGQLTLLDPACGSGRFLVAALQQWGYLAHTLAGIAGWATPDPRPPWVKIRSSAVAADGTMAETDPLGIYRHLLTHGLYGLDLWPPAVELARLQLFLQLVEQTHDPQQLSGLPDLTLTLLVGNGLIGLVRVETERFEQVMPRKRRSAPAPADTATLQGNLLQPLMADTYQGVLAERQVRLEHYRSQTQLLAESGSVPDYAQADFWRDRIQALNQIAQDKLTHLLWKECSQQLSIRIQYQDAAGKRQWRLLQLADIEALNPFHWGFYFHHLLQSRGGFDMIMSHLPTGPVQPQVADFVDRYQDLLQKKNVAPSTFLRNRQQVLTIDAELNRAWSQYRGTFSLPNQYFRRSSHYPHSAPSPQGRLYWSRLYLERSLQLLRPGGRCGFVLDPFWPQASGAPLSRWLQAQTRLAAVLDLSNHGQLWPHLPARKTLCLLWGQAGGSTPTDPYRAYLRASQALTPSSLGYLLQRLIDLPS